MAGGGLKKKKGKKQGGSAAQQQPKKQAKGNDEKEGEDEVDEEKAEGCTEGASAGVAGTEASDEDAEQTTKSRQKTKSHRIEEAMAKADEEDDGEPRGVIYLGRIPSGFCEPQMKKFFGQFGKLTRWRLARSSKNAAPQGYAFLEFEGEDVAKIVADTMNNYMMFGKKLVCNVVPKSKVGYNMFPKNCEKLQINRAPSRKRKACAVYNDRPIVEVNGEKVPQTTIRQAERRKKKEFNLRKRLEQLGIEFDPRLADPEEGGGGEEEGTKPPSGAPASKAAEEPGGPPAKQPKKKRRKQEEIPESPEKAETEEPSGMAAKGGDVAAQESPDKPHAKRKLRKVAKRVVQTE